MRMSKSLKIRRFRKGEEVISVSHTLRPWVNLVRGTVVEHVNGAVVIRLEGSEQANAGLGRYTCMRDDWVFHKDGRDL
jgi:hypothetical protein